MTGLDFSERDARARPRASRAAVEWVRGDLLALPFDDGEFDAATVGFGVRNVDRPRGRAARARARARARAAGSACLEITRPRGLLAPFFRLWFDGVVPLARQGAPGGAAYTYLPASVRRFPGPGGLAGGHARAPASRTSAGGCSPAASSPCTRRSVTGVSDALATIRAAPGPRRATSSELEDAPRGRPSRSLPGPRRRDVGAETLAAGGKRLRPLLVFLATPPAARATDRRSPAASRSSSCTWRRSSTTTCSTAPTCAAGRPTAWAAYGERCRAEAAGDYLFARAFAELARHRRRRAPCRSSPTRRSRSPAARRSSAGRRSTRTRPSTTTSRAAR